MAYLDEMRGIGSGGAGQNRPVNTSAADAGGGLAGRGDAAARRGGDLGRDAGTSYQDATGERETCNENRASRPCGRALAAEQVNLLEWLESQCSVTRVWLDRLIAEGDPDDMVSVIHRQAAWLDLVRERLDRA